MPSIVNIAIVDPQVSRPKARHCGAEEPPIALTGVFDVLCVFHISDISGHRDWPCFTSSFIHCLRDLRRHCHPLPFIVFDASDASAPQIGRSRSEQLPTFDDEGRHMITRFSSFGKSQPRRQARRTMAKRSREGDEATTAESLARTSDLLARARVAQAQPPPRTSEPKLFYPPKVTDHVF